MLQRCSRHGHLYRYGGALYPNQQRYNKDSNSFEQQPIVAQVSTTSNRSKRNVVANTFPMKIENFMPGLRKNNQILKVPSVEDENQNRIDEIIKKNFGEDPTEDIDELLRPKPLVGSMQKIESKERKDKVVDVPDLTPDFIAKLKPKLEEAKANFRSRISKIVNKARLDAIKASHMIQKRSTESSESDVPEMFSGENFDGNYESIWFTDESAESDGIENSIAKNPKNVDSDRIRKHCDRCGELAKKFPCPSCGGPIPSDVSQPQHFQMTQRNLNRYVPQQRTPPPSQPKYDQFDDVTVGSYHNRPAYGELQDILSKNSGAIYEQNRGVGGGHLLQPMNFEHASDAIRFIQELTQRNNHENVDYYSNDYSYDVGARPQNVHAKRSFKIVPLAEKDDGSVFVKISPVKKSQTEDDDQTTLTPKSDDERNKKANFQKFVRDGKKYEILALNANGSDGGSVGSDEDLEILKYIHAVNQKGHRANDDASVEIDDPNIMMT